jgi:hypothetical protein
VHLGVASLLLGDAENDLLPAPHVRLLSARDMRATQRVSPERILHHQEVLDLGSDAVADPNPAAPLIAIVTVSRTLPLSAYNRSTITFAK